VKAASSAAPSAKKQLAFKLFRGGASVAAVAEKVELTPATVNEYLAEFIAAEKPASIFGWVPEVVCERVAAAADIHGTGRLKPVFLELNSEVSYDHIRIVFAFLATQQG
jgi:ATP-dependent DNA helicase RecQ